MTLLLALALAVPASAGLEIALDPRVELAAALELLGEDKGPKAFRLHGPYGAALTGGVKACAGHPAVAAYGRLRAGARPDWPAQALVELTRCLDDGLAVRARDDCRRSALAASAADFAASCDFAEALAAARPHAEKALAALAARGKEDPLALFREYTGLEPGASRVAPAPLLRPGKYWNGLSREGASFSIVTALSPADEEKLRFRWRPVALELWHENGHGALDPLLAASAPPPGLKVAACYESWPQCAREHMAQGLALRMAQWSAAHGKLSSPPSRHLNPRLPLQEKVAAALAEYEKERARWKTLAEFYPRWSQALGARPGSAPEAARPPASTPPDAELSAAVALAAADPAAARAALEALIAKRPKDGAALLSLAVLRRGDDKAASRVLVDRAVSAGGDGWLRPDALSTRASWKREDGDADGARKDLEEALSCAPLDWPRRAETQSALKAR